MISFFNGLSGCFIPAVIFFVIGYGLYRKVPIYDHFISGAKEGLRTCFEMLPFIIAIFIGIDAITSSGAMEYLQSLFRPLLKPSVSRRSSPPSSCFVRFPEAARSFWPET